MHFVLPSRSDWLLALAYFGSAAATVATTRFEGGVAFLWIAGAILMPYLARRPRREWAAPILLCAVASALATGLFGFGWQLAIPFAIVNMAEAYAGATLLARKRSTRAPFASLAWMGEFVIAVGLAAPLVGAALATVVVGVAGGSPIATFVNFFVGHALGNITFIPIVSLLISGEFITLVRALSRRRAIDTALVLALVAVTTAVTFSIETLPILFLPCGPVIVAIFRGRQIGAAVSIVLIALIGGALTAAGQGPIQLLDATAGERMQFFQFYLAAVVLTVLPVAADLRNRSRLHHELRISEQRYRMLADHSSDILMQVDVAGRIRFLSPSIRQIGGYEPEELIGKRPTELIAPEYHEKILAEHRRALEEPGVTRSFDYRAVTRDGRQRWFETHMKTIVDRDGQVEGILSVIRDITARKAVEAKLTAAALTDPLTGLPNRRAFWEAASTRPAASNDRMSCIAVIDIDHFKRVNDLHGHDGGDKVLVQLGVVARRIVRSSDLVARLGGEEFALLLCDTTLDDAIATCERLRHEVARMGVPTRTGMIRVTISGGVAAIGADGVEAAVKRADLALYQAKASGRDRLELAA